MDYWVIIFIPVTTVLLVVLFIQKGKKNTIPPILLTVSMLLGAVIGDYLIKPPEKLVPGSSNPYYMIAGLITGFVLFSILFFFYKAKTKGKKQTAGISNKNIEKTTKV